MHVKITGHHTDITPALRDYVKLCHTPAQYERADALITEAIEHGESNTRSAGLTARITLARKRGTLAGLMDEWESKIENLAQAAFFYLSSRGSASKTRPL